LRLLYSVFRPLKFVLRTANNLDTASQMLQSLCVPWYIPFPFICEKPFRGHVRGTHFSVELRVPIRLGLPTKFKGLLIPVDSGTEIHVFVVKNVANIMAWCIGMSVLGYFLYMELLRVSLLLAISALIVLLAANAYALCIQSRISLRITDTIIHILEERLSATVISYKT